MHTVRCGTSAILLLTIPALAQSSIVSPTVSATSEGTSGNVYPWTSAVLRRYQQIHADLGPGAKALKSLAFRLNAGAGSYTRTWPIDCELFMGINQGLGQSSFFFDRNYLLPRTNVVARKLINWGPQGQATSPGPVPFSAGMTILLDAPFSYVGSPFALVWEAVIYSNAAANTDSGLDADVGTTTIAPSSITGTGCVASGRGTAMTHVSSLTDVGGWLGWNFTVQSGPSSSSVVLGVGTQNPSLTVPGLCSSLFTDMVAMIPIGTTDAAGALTTQTAGAATFVLKNAAQSGTVYTQAHALDAGQIGVPVASSNGRMTTVPVSNLGRVCDVLRVFNDVGGTAAIEGNYFTTVSVNVGYALATQFGY